MFSCLSVSVVCNVCGLGACMCGCMHVWVLFLMYVFMCLFVKLYPSSSPRCRKRRRRWSDNNCTESLTRLYSLAATLTTPSGNVKPSSSSSSSPPTTSGKNIDDDQESLKELLGDSFLDHSSLMQLFTDSFDDSPTRDCNLSPRCVTPPPQNILCSSQHQSGESKISRSQTHSSSLIPKPDSLIIQPHTHSGITHSNTSVIHHLDSIGQATSEEDKASIPHLSATVKPNVLPEHHHTQSSRLTVNSNAKHNPPLIRPLLPQPNGSATNRTSNIYHNRNPSGMISQSLHSRLNLHSRSSILNPDSKLHSSRAVPFTNPKGSSAVASRFKAKEVSSSGQWKPQERPNSSNNEKDIESESEDDEFWTRVALSVDELEQGTNSNNVPILDETTVDVLFKFDDNIENTKSPKQSR